MKVGPLERVAFFLAVFIAGLCSLIYELLISTTASYFLGDSIKQFSLTIGIYMAAMGLGSYLTRYLPDDLLGWFVKVEVLLGIIGGLSVPILYYGFDQLSVDSYQFLTLGITFLIGVLTGFEIPLLVRILKTYYPLKSNLAYVLSLDYVGALFATLLFPFLLLPFVGTFKTSIIFGAVNVFLGLSIYRFFTNRLEIKKKRWMEPTMMACLVGFLLIGIFSDRLLGHWEDNFYTARIIYSKETPYQKLVLTKNKEDLRLYINRIIQFSSLDEYRYHESLAMIPLQSAPYKKSVLVLGGGEGLLAREILKDPKVENITIVDLDPEVFRLGKENKFLQAVNGNALHNPKVTLIPEDAMAYLRTTTEVYDVIIADLPDPSNEGIARLYSTAFFKLAQNKLSRYGIFATQATGPFHTRRAFWCIYESLKVSGFAEVYPYHTYVPSFGDWGFIIAANHPINPQTFDSDLPLKYLNTENVARMFYFEPDIDNPENLEINRLDHPVLLEYFLKDWERWRKDKKN